MFVYFLYLLYTQLMDWTHDDDEFEARWGEREREWDMWRYYE